MADSTAPRTMPATYFAMVERFPLVRIRDDRHQAEAQAVIDRLLREYRDEGAEEYLDALTDHVMVYEDGRFPIPDASEADVLRELMAANGLSQPKLAKAVGIAQSTISAVLTGALTLTKGQVATLAKFFNVSPMAFLPP